MKFLTALSVLVLAAGCATAPSVLDERTRYFLSEVKPVLQQHCLACHNGARPEPFLDLRSAESAFRTRQGGPLIVPGDPGRSLLIRAVERGGTHAKVMPRTELSLTDDQIGMLREWIEDGAYWPEGKTGALHVERTGENP
jgi:hypothetical protein